VAGRQAAVKGPLLALLLLLPLLLPLRRPVQLLKLVRHASKHALVFMASEREDERKCMAQKMYEIFYHRCRLHMITEYHRTCFKNTRATREHKRSHTHIHETNTQHTHCIYMLPCAGTIIFAQFRYYLEAVLSNVHITKNSPHIPPHYLSSFPLSLR